MIESGTTPKAEVKGAEERRDKKKDTRPTPDQVYLASRLSDTLSIRVLQRLNTRYGVTVVTDAMRCLHGFPPEIAVRSTYAYIVGIIEGSV